MPQSYRHLGGVLVEGAMYLSANKAIKVSSIKVVVLNIALGVVDLSILFFQLFVGYLYQAEPLSYGCSGQYAPALSNKLHPCSVR